MSSSSVTMAAVSGADGHLNITSPVSRRPSKEANEFTRAIHDRMPVLLGRDEWGAWLAGKAGIELLRPAPNAVLRMWPVSKRVNATGRGDDDPGLIEPIQPAI